MSKEKQEFMLIMEIVKRAEKLDLMGYDRMSLSMDLKTAHNQFNLRLDELLKSDDFNFAHDIVGIQNNINRVIGTIENLFVPRYASTCE